MSPLSLHHRREPLYFDFEPPSREVIGGNIPFYRLRKAQELTFGLMDHILKKSNRYEGFYILRFDNMMVEDAKIITVNNIPLSRDELKDFLIGRKHIEPYSFDFERYGMSYIV
ncbi:hypothetical protein HRbin04_01288 [archaeon HR04]|nr:hypothetical protein HRbin04_01288 [archaeon HR04]